MKVISFYRVGDAHDASAFQRWFRDVHAPRVLAEVDAPDGYVLNLVEPTPDDIPYRPPSEIRTGSERPAYDVVVEQWWDGGFTDARHALLKEALAPWDVLEHSYCVEEIVERDLFPAVAEGERSPGLKYMSRLQLHPDLPDAAARRSWAWHAALALKVHVGALKYVRNWVTQPLTPDPLTCRGVVQLHFPTREDLLQRFFDSERGREEILHDVGHFVSLANRLYVGEHVLRRPHA